MLKSEFEKLEIGDRVWLGGQAKEANQFGTIISKGHFGVRIRFDNDEERNSSYKFLSLTAPVETIGITAKNLEDILYHLDGYMFLIQYGKEYAKMVELVKQLPLQGKDLSKFYLINRIVNQK